MKRSHLRRKTASESNTVAAICEYLTYKKAFFWRNNNTPIYDPTNQRFRAMPKYTMKGIPDIIVIRPGGLFCRLEVKTEKSRLSKEQEIFSNEVRDVGGEYHLVRGIDDVQRIGL
jgi:hypothetical protein